MWLFLALGSALALGVYDVVKKQALRTNGVLYVLLCATALSTLFLSPFLSSGPLEHHLLLIAKAALVTICWISGLIALKLLPITTASTIKASRPMFVVLFSVLIFGEKLNVWQWAGVAVTLAALYLLSRSSKREGIDFTHNRGILAMSISVLTGVASALFDKYILKLMEPLFVQSWCNLYITAFLAVTVLVTYLRDREGAERFRWDWKLLLIAVLITGSDFLYFFALKQDGALLSVISLLRRCSVIVTFTLGAILFKEQNIRAKAADLTILLAGILMLLLGSL